MLCTDPAWLLSVRCPSVCTNLSDVCGYFPCRRVFCFPSVTCPQYLVFQVRLYWSTLVFIVPPQRPHPGQRSALDAPVQVTLIPPHCHSPVCFPRLSGTFCNRHLRGLWDCVKLFVWSPRRCCVLGTALLWTLVIPGAALGRGVSPKRMCVRAWVCVSFAWPGATALLGHQQDIVWIVKRFQTGTLHFVSYF